MCFGITFLDVSMSPFSGSFPVTRSAWAIESPAGHPTLKNDSSQPPEFSIMFIILRGIVSRMYP
jgi:hypothetical protein